MTAKVYQKHLGPLGFKVDAAKGAHIIAFEWEGRNCLATHSPEVGSTFWPSPQSHWGWPPPFELDKGHYSVEEHASGFCFVSDVCSQTHLRIQKNFELFANRMRVTYTMINYDTDVVHFAPWEISRIGGGLTFYSSTQPPLSNSTGRVDISDGAVWHSYQPEKQLEHQKIFGNGSSGWVANLFDGLLLVKRFAPVPSEWVAPGEGEVEIYAHCETGVQYIEMEQQGRYELIPPQGELRWQVEWYIKPCPINPPRLADRSYLIREVNHLLSL